MDQFSELEKRICVVWNTKRPLLDSPRKSSNITLLGSRWNFHMAYNSRNGIVFNSGNYYLSFQPENKTQDLEKPLSFYVTAFIEDKNSHDVFKLGGTKKLSKMETEICSFNENHVSKIIPRHLYNEEWRILCLFHASVQMTLERIHVSPQTDMISNPDSLSVDLSNLLDKETFADVTIKCGDRSISAHRSILAARSEVFAAMFRNKMVESETGVVPVTDLEAPVLDLLLRYAYTGKVTDLTEDMAPSLYAAGDKYLIYSLKKACADWMIRNLTEGNCIGFLTLADVHSDPAFKEAVISFICDHESLLESEDWLGFSKEHSILAVEVYQKVFRVKRRRV